MDVKRLHNIQKKIKVGLVFFCLVLIAGCGSDQVTIEQLDYESEKAVGVTFSTEMDVEQLRVFVGEESQTSVIGVIVSQEGKHSFSPVIPFRPGQTYTLRKNNTEVLASFTIPEREGSEAVALLAIYPQLDTVPENLLKMYFEFEAPMQEVGNALDFIRVTNETDGIAIAPFLRLESELWNQDRTLLTLWLDPGRIKTDLIPNREKGLPLREGKTYTVAIDSSWKSNRGTPLKQAYTQRFYVHQRDDQKPVPEEWRIRQKNDASKSLEIDFGEPMDAFLAQETIRFYDRNAQRIDGRVTLFANQSRLRFVPDSEWTGPKIEIRIESRLEDLAGNNLTRRFDSPVLEGESVADSPQVRSLIYTLAE